MFAVHRAGKTFKRFKGGSNVTARAAALLAATGFRSVNAILYSNENSKQRTFRCVCVFSSHSFWTSMDVPAGVTQEEGSTGFSIHLLSAVLAFIFIARRIQPFLSLVDREVEFCVLTI